MSPSNTVSIDELDKPFAVVVDDVIRKMSAQIYATQSLL